MALFSKEFGIDLGTMYTRIVEGGVVVLEEPTIVAIEIEKQKMVAIGEEARGMFGRVSDEIIQVTRPLQNGVVAYYEYTQIMLGEQIKKVSGPLMISKPRLMVTHPHGVTSVERRAVHEAALEVSRDADLVPQPLAAALGIDLPVGTPSGNMIVCLGGGCSQAAVIAMHDIVAGETLRMGGMELDEAIVSYVRKKYGLVIAQPTAEQIKIKIGAAIPQDEELSMELQGQDQVTGLPRPFTLTTGEVVEALQTPLDAIFENARHVLE
ncbi:MAG: rod shape-determining protein, partial [Anaerolineales bacterium]|nr:rod shape-determining protein [Anaerolineales bacterium]